MIEWKGLYANTPYSSANNKMQDDAVTGMRKRADDAAAAAAKLSVPSKASGASA